MKVYIRRWKKGERNYVQEGSHEIDAYNGLTFFQLVKIGDPACEVRGKVRTIFLHASEKNALVVYVDDVERKEPL